MKSLLNGNFAGQSFDISVSKEVTLRDVRLLIGEQMTQENLLKKSDTLMVSTGLRGGAGKRKVCFHSVRPRVHQQGVGVEAWVKSLSKRRCWPVTAKRVGLASPYLTSASSSSGTT